MALYEGTLKAPKAWMTGRLKIKGNKYAMLSFKPDVIMAEIGVDIWEVLEGDAGAGVSTKAKKPLNTNKVKADVKKRQSTKLKMDKMKEMLENAGGGEEERRKIS